MTHTQSDAAERRTNFITLNLGKHKGTLVETPQSGRVELPVKDFNPAPAEYKQEITDYGMSRSELWLYFKE